jgi:hypothetical protein
VLEEINFGETVEEVRNYFEIKIKPRLFDDTEEWGDLTEERRIYLAVMYGVDLATRGVEDGE